MVLAVTQAPLPDASGLFKEMPAEADYMANLTLRVSQELGARSRDDVARATVLLQAPGGAVYSVYVDDLGVLHAVKVRG